MGRASFRTAALIGFVLAASAAVGADSDPPPDWVPELRLSYLDPATGSTVACSEPCRRFEVPDGAVLTVGVTVASRGGEPRSDGPVWDLWWDQRLHPFPGIDTAACVDADGTVDLPCWGALVERVDWASWQALPADVSCVPEEPGGCLDVILQVPVSARFDGSRGRGVYSLALWVDRFRAVVERNELDNFAGPVRVVARAGDTAAPETEDAAAVAPPEQRGAGTLVSGAVGKPFAVAVLDETVDQGFALSSPRSRATVGFNPGIAGEVVVEVDQVGAWGKIVVEVRKVSTGEILQEARGLGRLRLEGPVHVGLLKDDRRFEVVVRLDEGTRGVRGTVRVTYPARAKLIASPPTGAER
ncbi:MAG TPA: hypothetical protein VLT81_03790 [Chondromyces sp.]|nr:hypothetical protein [Chondromyces sp.]